MLTLTKVYSFSWQKSRMKKGRSEEISLALCWEEAEFKELWRFFVNCINSIKVIHNLLQQLTL